MLILFLNSRKIKVLELKMGSKFDTTFIFSGGEK